jgi:hypothetical protein
MIGSGGKAHGSTDGGPMPFVRPRRSLTLLQTLLQCLLGTLIVLLATGCHHHVQQAYQPPPPPAPYRTPAPRGTVVRNVPPNIPPAPRSYPNEAIGRPEFVETGMASWYGTGTRAADGTAFDKSAMTAAHRTLPMGTTVRVTNLANGESVTVRITDRGPFVNGRVLDLSEGAAKQIDLYRMGVAKVKIEVFAHPGASADRCLQDRTRRGRPEDRAPQALRRRQGYRVPKLHRLLGPHRPTPVRPHQGRGHPELDRQTGCDVAGVSGQSGLKDRG